MAMNFDDREKDQKGGRGLRANDTNAASGGNGVSPSLIGFGAVAVLAVIFFFQNSETINVNFWLFDWDTTIRWSLLMAMVLGVLLDRLFGMWWRRRGRKKDEAKRARDLCPPHPPPPAPRCRPAASTPPTASGSRSTTWAAGAPCCS